jgi:hypothetical protein
MKIISVSGFIASGKDTAANYLVRQKGFRQESFASTLKDAISCVFGWDRIMLEGLTLESRQWREQVDSWWAQRLNIPHLTPRWVMQYWGTEVCRQGFHDDIWVAGLENRLRNSNEDIVISDVRFPNELLMLKRINAITVWIKRTPFPDWYSTAIAANKGHQFAVDELKRLKIHSSETSWVGYDFDHEIYNDSTLTYLYQCIDDLLEGR